MQDQVNKRTREVQFSVVDSYIEYQRQKGLNFQEMAKAIGMSVLKFQNMVTGHDEFNIHDLAKISSVISMDFDLVFKKQDSVPEAPPTSFTLSN